MTIWKQHRELLAALLLTILYAFHFGIPLYVTSTYLSVHNISPAGISVFYFLSALVTIFVSNHLNKYVRRFHTYSFTFFIVLAQILVTLGFAFASHALTLFLFFVGNFVLSTIIFTMVNLYIEHFTPRHETGAIRGIFLTLLNLGILIAPFIGGSILSQYSSVSAESLRSVYIVSSACLIPFLFFLHHYLKSLKDPADHSVDLFHSFKKAFKNKDLRGALLGLLMLEVFFGVMVVNLPLYLQEQFAIDIPTFLTVLAPIALIPFVILPYELGTLADEKYGEKEFLILGLSIMAVSCFAVGLITTSSLLVWTLLLFVSRVGAATVETMLYSYYFKKIPSHDPSLTAVFTNMRNIGLMVFTAISFALSPLLLISPQAAFILLGIALAVSITSVLNLHDTR